MAQTRIRLRGSGFKHTLPYLWPYSSIWVLVFLVSAPGTFIGFLMTDVLTEEGREATQAFLLTRMPIVVVAVALLAVVLTARLAGPFVALKRAFADVAAGDMRRRLEFRDGESHLRGVEDGFNAMMDAVESHLQGQGAEEDGSDDAERPLIR